MFDDVNGMLYYLINCPTGQLSYNHIFKDFPCEASSSV